MNKKIGFLIMNIENGGGTERVTSVITNELVERGYEITIISCQHGNCCKFTLNKKSIDTPLQVKNVAIRFFANFMLKSSW